MWQSILIKRAKIILIFSWPKQTVYFGTFSQYAANLVETGLWRYIRHIKNNVCLFVLNYARDLAKMHTCVLKILKEQNRVLIRYLCP